MRKIHVVEDSERTGEPPPSVFQAWSGASSKIRRYRVMLH